MLYPVGVVSDLRHGGGARRAAGRSPCPNCPAAGRDLAAVDPADAEPGPPAVDQLAVQPDRRLTDLDEAAAWGREHGVPVFSDECYAEFTWDGPPRTASWPPGSEGVVAVHSLSKRSNLAGVRAGFFAGDPELVGFLLDVRRHAGLMVPGPVQAGGGGRFADDDHVDRQRQPLPRAARPSWPAQLAAPGFPTPLPAGGFYLWVPVPGTVDGGGWGLAETPGPRRPGCWSAPGSSTVPTVRASSGSPSSSPWTVWPWWPSGWPVRLTAVTSRVLGPAPGGWPGASGPRANVSPHGRPPVPDRRAVEPRVGTGTRPIRMPWPWSPRPSTCWTAARPGWPRSTRPPTRWSCING